MSHCTEVSTVNDLWCYTRCWEEPTIQV